MKLDKVALITAFLIVGLASVAFGSFARVESMAGRAQLVFTDQR